MRPAKVSKEAKIQALLDESDDWEKGRRGSESRRATPEEQQAQDQKLDLHMISIRLPSQAVNELKQRAAKKGIGYQPYIRQLIMDHLSGSETSLEERLSRLEKLELARTGSR
jgi:predicted DNA binding CopG/RHH family protein